MASATATILIPADTGAEEGLVADRRDVRISFDPTERWGDDYMDVRIKAPKNLARSKLTVVGPTIEPDHWREEIRSTCC